MKKSTLIIGVAVTVSLAVAVVALYVYGQKKLIRDSINQFNIAKSLYDNSQWMEAEQLFSEIERKYRRSDVAPESSYYGGIMLQAGGQYEEALEKWKRLSQIENNPRAMEIYYYIGYCQEMIGRKSESAEQYARLAGMQQAGEFAGLAKAGLARIAEKEGSAEKARALYEEALALVSAKETRDSIKSQYGNLNLRMFMQPREGEFTESYLIKPGDSIVAIAINRKSTVDLLCKINDIENPASIRPNKRILIPLTDFSVMIDKSDFEMTLYNHGAFFKSYKVGLGKKGCTPVGEFVIDNKMKNPTWWSPNQGPIPPGDPRNELGTRWMGLKPLTPGVGTDYGIHGTIDPSTIGWESSNGCPRMYPKDAEELFMLVTEGTPVTIQE